MPSADTSTVDVVDYFEVKRPKKTKKFTGKVEYCSKRRANSIIRLKADVINHFNLKEDEEVHFNLIDYENKKAVTKHIEKLGENEIPSLFTLVKKKKKEENR